jgi:hypothetical protein
MLRWIGLFVLGGTGCSADPSYDTAALGWSPLPFLDEQPAVGCAASERDPHLVVVVVNSGDYVRLAVESDDRVVAGASIDVERVIGDDASAHVESGPGWPTLCPGVEAAWGGPGEARSWRATAGELRINLTADPSDRARLTGTVELVDAWFDEEGGDIPFALDRVDLQPVEVVADP